MKNAISDKDDVATKKDCKAHYLLHQSMDLVNFEKISKTDWVKEAWDILQKAYGGAKKTKKVRLQSLRRQYELLFMLDQKTLRLLREDFTRIVA